MDKPNIKLPAAFKFKGKWLSFIASLIATFLFVYFGVLTAKEKSPPVWLLILLFGNGILIPLAAIGLLKKKSTIIVDDISISKKLLIFIWKKFEWKNVTVIKSRSIYIPYDRNETREISIMENNKKFVFWDTAEDADKLLDFINYQAEKYNIPVEVK